MASRVIISAFNEQFNDFIGNLIKTFPGDRDFTSARSGANVLLTFDDKQLIQLFERYIPPYEEKIIGRDEQFFLENNYAEIALATNVASDIIDKLKKLWRELDYDNRVVVWEYLGNLVKLCQKYRSLKTQ
jgi:hypothetical protein